MADATGDGAGGAARARLLRAVPIQRIFSEAKAREF